MAAVDELTEVIQKELRNQVINIERAEFTELVRDVEKVYKGELLDREDIPIPGESAFQRDQAVTREIARALDYFFERSPEGFG